MSFILDPSKKMDVLPGTAPVVSLKLGRFNDVENQLSDSLFKALNFVEQTWWERSQVPPLDKITNIAGLTKQESADLWQNDLFLESLRRRNLDPNEMVGSEGLLSREQLIVANMQLNIADKRSIREKLKDINIKPAVYQTWLNDPVFLNYLKIRAEKLFNNTDTEAYLALIDGVNQRDFSSVKLFLEMRGLYNPRVTVDVNIEQVLVRVVDIIARHVDDPVALENIANEIEGLASKSKAIPVTSMVGTSA